MGRCVWMCSSGRGGAGLGSNIIVSNTEGVARGTDITAWDRPAAVQAGRAAGCWFTTPAGIPTLQAQLLVDPPDSRHNLPCATTSSAPSAGRSMNRVSPLLDSSLRSCMVGCAPCCNAYSRLVLWQYLRRPHFMQIPSAAQCRLLRAHARNTALDLPQVQQPQSLQRGLPLVAAQRVQRLHVWTGLRAAHAARHAHWRISRVLVIAGRAAGTAAAPGS